MHDSRLVPTYWEDITPANTGIHDLIGFRVETTAGNVAVEFWNGNSHTFRNVQLYETITGHIKRINSTSTTAAGFSGAKK